MAVATRPPCAGLRCQNKRNCSWPTPNINFSPPCRRAAVNFLEPQVVAGRPSGRCSLAAKSIRRRPAHLNSSSIFRAHCSHEPPPPPPSQRNSLPPPPPPPPSPPSPRRLFLEKPSATNGRPACPLPPQVGRLFCARSPSAREADGGRARVESGPGQGISIRVF